MNDLRGDLNKQITVTNEKKWRFLESQKPRNQNPIETLNALHREKKASSSGEMRRSIDPAIGEED